jgi:hypothetical protein
MIRWDFRFLLEMRWSSARNLEGLVKRSRTSQPMHMDGSRWVRAVRAICWAMLVDLMYVFVTLGWDAVREYLEALRLLA